MFIIKHDYYTQYCLFMYVFNLMISHSNFLTPINYIDKLTDIQTKKKFY